MLSLLALLACTKDAPLDEVYSGCDPIDTTRCMLPFPSTYNMKRDDSQVSGWKVNFSATALPTNRDDVQMGPEHWNEKDGFSTVGPIMAFFDDLDVADLVSHQDIQASLEDGASTTLINAETGERAPHFAELDMSGENPSQAMLIIRPMMPLEHGARYVVGIRGLHKTDGSSVDVSEAFAALRDGTETQDWDVEGRRDYFDQEIFQVLQEDGWERSETQLAWDFVTVSKENSLGRLMWMRDDAAERSGATGPAYEITKIDEEDCSAGATIGRTIYADLTVPMYTESPEPPSLLTRDESGQPYYNGDTTAEVMIRVPCSLILDPEPAQLVQYGHGLLGSIDEARTGWLSHLANENKWIVVASDFIGMAEEDISSVTLMMALDPGKFAQLPERSMQGFVQQDQALRAVRGELGQDPALMVDGVNLVDPSRVAYYGVSQGGILGPAYVGMSDQITRGVFGVAGSPYNILLSRSADFDPFFLVFKAKFIDQRDIALVLGLMQQLWDPAEGAGWTRAFNREPFEGQPAKTALIQNAIGDAQVSTLGGQLLARSFGASLVTPQTREVWGLQEQQAPFNGSALVEWYYTDGAEEPLTNTPPEKDGDTHDCPRKEPMAQLQVADFIETGVVEQYCDGVCEELRAGRCD